MFNKKVSLLSPAGSFESLSAAIQAGADAIYFGVEQLNMRSRAAYNFTLEDLQKISNQCIDNNVRSYLTLNTVMYDHDLSIMKEIMDAAKTCGIHAIIAADQAALMHGKKIGMPIHISTQANVTNIDTVEFYAQFADLIVVSRELSLNLVKNLAQEIKRRQITGPSGKVIQLEVFAHGALCMAVSGKCYISLHAHNASANRGACLQNCRHKYTVIDQEEGVEMEVDNEYIMSAKDLCTIPFLDKVLSSGVDVIKIEGRGRAPEYVYAVTKAYREAIDAIAAKQFTRTKIDHWMAELSTVYNRGFWSGYYLGQEVGEWSNQHGSIATEKKTYIGKVIKYYPKAKVAEFLLESHSVKTGDTILITGPSSGVIKMEMPEMRLNDNNVSEVKKGDRFTSPFETFLRPSDRLYKISLNHA